MRFAFGKIRSKAVAGVGSVLAVCSAGLYGAFDALPKPPPAQFTPGSPLDAGQWRVVPRKAWLGTGKVYGVPIRDDQMALVLEADLMNRTQASSNDYSELFQLDPPAGAGVGKLMVVATRDPQAAPYLHPGLNERVAFIWAMPRSAALASPLVLGVQAKTFKPIDNLYGTPGWYNPRRIGRVALPLAAPVRGPA